MPVTQLNSYVELEDGWRVTINQYYQFIQGKPEDKQCSFNLNSNNRKLFQFLGFKNF